MYTYIKTMMFYWYFNKTMSHLIWETCQLNVILWTNVSWNIVRRIHKKVQRGILAGSSEYDSTFLNQSQSMIEEADQNLQQFFLARTITTLYSWSQQKGELFKDILHTKATFLLDQKKRPQQSLSRLQAITR